MATQAEERTAATAFGAEISWLRRPGQFTILLIAMLAFLLVPPLFINYESTGVLASTFLSLLLISALYVFPRRGEFRLACILAVPTLLGRWLVLGFHDSAVLMIVVVLCWIGFLILTATVILRQVLTATRVSNDTISGAICAYLLIGLTFAFLYALVALAYPGSFLIDGRLVQPKLERLFYQHEISNLIYYSFVTLTTVGYGDIAPISAPARMTAVIEAMAGQFYVAILIARLVSIRYARWGGDD